MNNYISIKVILDNLLDHPMLLDLTLERVVNYTLEFLRIVQAPLLFIEKVESLEVLNYRAILPCDYHQMILVRTKDNLGEVLRSATDSFHMSEDKKQLDFTYKIQGRIIYTSMKEATIEIAYRAIAVDNNGYPLIPDNASFIKALELYIKKLRFTILTESGKMLPLILSLVQLDYAWAVGQALSDLIKPSIDEMESITNSWNTLIPRTNSHGNSFAMDGAKEKIKIQ